MADINLATLTSTQGFRVLGEHNFDYSGSSVSNAGDVNNDGYADVIIGAYSASSAAGKSYVIFGKASGFSDINLITLNSTVGFGIIGEYNPDYSGWSVSSAGDVNHDGYADVIVGAIHYDNGAGKSYVIFGKAGGFSDINLITLNSTVGFGIIGENYVDDSGISVSSAGDVNHDGFADVIIGASYASSKAGASYVIFGKASGFSNIALGTLSNTQGFRILGENSNDYSGGSVSSAGDINKDGYADVIIGAYGASSNTGKSYVIFGKASGFSDINLSTLNSTVGFRIIGENVNDHSGVSVSSAGDINKDGFADVIIGANGALSIGKSYVIFGKASGFSDINLSSLNSTVGFRIIGENTGDAGNGIAVSSVGDVNGDGYADVIVGANGASSNGYTANGKSYVIFGKASGFSDIYLNATTSAQGFSIIGENNDYDRSGSSVSGAGDVNQDGFADIIIGAPSASSGTGKSYVIFGSNSTTVSTTTSPTSTSTTTSPTTTTTVTPTTTSTTITPTSASTTISPTPNPTTTHPTTSGATDTPTTTPTTTTPTSTSVATSSTTHAITSTITGGATTDTINATTFTTANMNVTSSTEKGALVTSSASHLEVPWPLKLLALTVSTTVEVVKQGIESTSHYLDAPNILTAVGLSELVHDIE